MNVYIKLEIELRIICLKNWY